MAVFAISLAVASLFAYELLLQDGRRDIDVVIERERQRFDRSVSALLSETQAEAPTLSTRDALEVAVRRYLELNPSTDSYWTIVTFADGRQLAAGNGPPELEPLFRAGELPVGTSGQRETIGTGTAAGEIRTSSVPVSVGDAQLATLQIVAPLAPVRAEAREAAWLVAAAAGISLLLGGILLAASLWRSLAPLVELAATARSTELRKLDARVAVADADDEVGVLATEFNTMLERLEHASQQQREFMASIGHELRTPITIARGHLELLERVRTADPEAVRETATIVRDELGRMGRLVDDLMAIARAEMDDFCRPRDLDLVAWFEELELKLAGMPAGDAVRIHPPPPVVLRADPDRLAQAVLNLVSNAHVHTPPGTRVRIEAHRGGSYLAIVVADDGPGIPEEIREQAFSPFVRAGDAAGSTGLGLSVVRAVVDAHEGDIVVASGADGTAIELRLPWSPAGPDDGELPHDEVLAGHASHDTLRLVPGAEDGDRPTLRLRTDG